MAIQVLTFQQFQQLGDGISSQHTIWNMEDYADEYFKKKFDELPDQEQNLILVDDDEYQNFYEQIWWDSTQDFFGYITEEGRELTDAERGHLLEEVNESLEAMGADILEETSTTKDIVIQFGREYANQAYHKLWDLIQPKDEEEKGDE